MMRCNMATIGKVALAAILMAGPAAADWQALVVGAPGPGAERAFADAFHVARALSNGSAAGVQLLRDMPPQAARAAAEGLAGQNQVLIYLSGSWSRAGITMQGEALDPAALVAGLAGTGTDRVVLLVEDCAHLDPSKPGRFIAPPAPPGLDLFVAASAGAGDSCPAEDERLTDLLTEGAAPADGNSLDRLLAELWTQGTTPAPASLFAPPPPVTPVADVVTIIPVAPPRLRASPPVAEPNEVGDTVQIFVPAPDSRLAALPRAVGLPEPSIIVGLIDPVQAEPDGAEFRYDDLATRTRLRRDEPERFAQLVAAGAFDPPEGQVALALQEELSRMGCYTSTIDGIWGGGSRAALERYFAERPDAEPAGLDPLPQTFRLIVQADDVACPAPPPPVAQRTPTQRATPRPAATAAPRQAAPPPPAQPAQPAPVRRLITPGTALGVIR